MFCRRGSKRAKLLSSPRKNIAQLRPSVRSTVPFGHRFAIKKDTSVFACTFLSIAETGFEPVFAHLEISSSALPLCAQSAELRVMRQIPLPHILFFLFVFHFRIATNVDFPPFSKNAVQIENTGKKSFPLDNC